MKPNIAKTSKNGATFGRPRLLTHDEILEGAIELGLENITMKKLATHLSVGTATLYQYFSSRKSLLRAAAVHSLSHVPMPKDMGQHWSLFARDYATSIQAVLAENPTFIYSHQHTAYGFEVHFRLIEPFLQSMANRGFSAKDGMEVFNLVGMAAFGGAIEAVRQHEFEYQDETMTVVAKRQFDRLDKSKFPYLAEAFDDFTASPEQKVESLLRAAFATIARNRGESESVLFSGET